jgi:hypothetical protein
MHAAGLIIYSSRRWLHSPRSRAAIAAARLDCYVEVTSGSKVIS